MCCSVEQCIIDPVLPTARIKFNRSFEEEVAHSDGVIQFNPLSPNTRVSVLSKFSAPTIAFLAF